MLAKEINVTEIAYDARIGRYIGEVSMQLEPDSGGVPANIYYRCSTEEAENCPSSLVVYGLIKDALRQARRMPGFRNGERKIKVDISTVSFAA